MGAIEAGHEHDDVMFSFLPLAHIYERLNAMMAVWGGAPIGFFHGDVTDVPNLYFLLI